LVRLDTVEFKFESQGHRSKFTTTKQQQQRWLAQSTRWMCALLAASG